MIKFWALMLLKFIVGTVAVLGITAGILLAAGAPGEVVAVINAMIGILLGQVFGAYAFHEWSDWKQKVDR